MAILVKSTWTNAKRILVSMAECVWIRLAVLSVDVHLVSVFYLLSGTKFFKRSNVFVRKTIFLQDLKANVVKLFWNSATPIRVKMTPCVSFTTIPMNAIAYQIFMANDVNTNTTIACCHLFQS